VQAGVDVWRGSLIPGHRDVAGVYFAYGNSNLDVDGLVTNATATAYVMGRTGKLNLDAYSGGAYWTHYGPGGWHLDLVLQGTSYQGEATTQSARLPTTGNGFVTSLEAGYPVPLPLGPRFVLEPQIQVLWQRVSFDGENDGLGPVDLGSTTGTTGRLGLRGQWTIDGDNGQVWQPYGRVNLWHDWGGSAATMFGADQVPLKEEATRLEFAAGVRAFRAIWVFGTPGDCAQSVTQPAVPRDRLRSHRISTRLAIAQAGGSAGVDHVVVPTIRAKALSAMTCCHGSQTVGVLHGHLLRYRSRAVDVRGTLTTLSSRALSTVQERL
jgi:hypothetical protein